MRPSPVMVGTGGSSAGAEELVLIRGSGFGPDEDDSDVLGFFGDLFRLNLGRKDDGGMTKRENESWRLSLKVGGDGIERRYY